MRSVAPRRCIDAAQNQRPVTIRWKKEARRIRPADKSASVPSNKSKSLERSGLQLSHVWSIRAKLEAEDKTRDLALFNLAIDCKLRERRSRNVGSRPSATIQDQQAEHDRPPRRVSASIGCVLIAISPAANPSRQSARELLLIGLKDFLG
jgi:hypothetical protein